MATISPSEANLEAELQRISDGIREANRMADMIDLFIQEQLERKYGVYGPTNDERQDEEDALYFGDKV